MKKEKIASIIMGVIILILIVFAVLFVLSKEKREEPATSESAVPSTEIITESHTETTEATTQEKITKETTTQPTTKKSDEKVSYVDMNSEEWYLTILSKKNRLPENYRPKTDYLVSGNAHELDVRVAPYYIQMYEAARKEGCYLTPFSGYRSIERQTINFNRELSNYQAQGYSYDEAYKKVSAQIMPPGTSEHNAGIAMDIVSISVNFENSKEFDWLRKHAHEYGFILRYPKGKTDITGIVYEPWHWRYVGKEAATEIRQRDCTLEEYMKSR